MEFEYKYQTQLDALLASGFSMPEVHTPDGKSALRFVFAQAPGRNHLPVCVSNPKRILRGPIKTSGYALSCFADKEKAKLRFHALESTFKQIRQTIGDSLAEGEISNEDGRITSEDTNTSHFDLYESTTCDLNRTFTQITAL